MATSSPYRPSPLSFGSPRTSPFRRPESPASPSPLRSASVTPTASPIKPSTPQLSPSKHDSQNYGSANAADKNNWKPRGITPGRDSPVRELPPSPTRNGRSTQPGSLFMRAAETPKGGDALSRLPPAQVREMREAFQLLDRNSDGQVTRDDVADMLSGLGQDNSTKALSSFFPPSQAQTITMAHFLTSLSTLLAPLSSGDDLSNAFSAFDEDDNGQIDVTDLRDALLHTSPEEGASPLTESEVDKVLGAGFVSRRTFGKGSSGRGDVFRWQEFVTSVLGSGKDESMGQE